MTTQPVLQLKNVQRGMETQTMCVWVINVSAKLKPIPVGIDVWDAQVNK